MRQSDIFTVIAVTVVGVIVSSIFLNMILGNPDEKSVQFKTVAVVEPSLTDPDPEVFNLDAINPTVEVYVGECLDVDQDGQLSEAELIACGRVDGATDTSGNNDENEDSENSESSSDTTPIDTGRE